MLELCCLRSYGGEIFPVLHDQLFLLLHITPAFVLSLQPEAADCLSSPPVPHACLDLHKHQGAAPGKNPSCHESTKPEGRSTRRPTNAARRSRSAKTPVQRSRTQNARAAVSSSHGQLLVRGVPAATGDREPRTASSSLGSTRQSLQSGRPAGMTRSTSRGAGPSPGVAPTPELRAIQQQQQPVWLDVITGKPTPGHSTCTEAVSEGKQRLTGDCSADQNSETLNG